MDHGAARGAGLGTRCGRGVDARAGTPTSSCSPRDRVTSNEEQSTGRKGGSPSIDQASIAENQLHMQPGIAREHGAGESAAAPPSKGVSCQRTSGELCQAPSKTSIVPTQLIQQGKEPDQPPVRKGRAPARAPWVRPTHTDQHQL
ncbi:unnamed protein product [Lampetra planeri]